MACRTGKREREARNRSKRGYVYAELQGGTVVLPLKLGRKKARAFGRSTRWSGPGLFCYGSTKIPEWAMTAVPVADAERRAGGDQGEEPADSPPLRHTHISFKRKPWI